MEAPVPMCYVLGFSVDTTTSCKAGVSSKVAVLHVLNISLTHLICMNESPSACHNRGLHESANNPFVWIKCVVTRKHLRRARHRPSKIGFGHPYGKEGKDKWHRLLLLCGFHFFNQSRSVILWCVHHLAPKRRRYRFIDSWQMWVKWQKDLCTEQMEGTVSARGGRTSRKECGRAEPWKNFQAMFPSLWQKQISTRSYPSVDALCNN